MTSFIVTYCLCSTVYCWTGSVDEGRWEPLLLANHGKTNPPTLFSEREAHIFVQGRKRLGEDLPFKIQAQHAKVGRWD